MAGKSPELPLQNMLDAIEHIVSKLEGVSLPAFEADWEQRWLVERGID